MSFRPIGRKQSGARKGRRQCSCCDRDQAVVAEAMSTETPGPIVEDTDTFFM
jgi:hypothetical protein